MTITDTPVIPIPSNPAFQGMTMQMQVVMYNPIDFPHNPFQWSNYVEVVVGGASSAYGDRNGMALWIVEPTPLGGSLVPRFAVGGF